MPNSIDLCRNIIDILQSAVGRGEQAAGAALSEAADLLASRPETRSRERSTHSSAPHLVDDALSEIDWAREQFRIHRNLLAHAQIRTGNGDPGEPSRSVVAHDCSLASTRLQEAAADLRARLLAQEGACHDRAATPVIRFRRHLAATAQSG